MAPLWAFLHILPVLGTGFYLKARDRYNRLAAIKDERLELVTQEEAERDHLRTKFFIQDDRIVSSLGIVCGQEDSSGVKSMYICRSTSYDGDWMPHPVDDGNMVQIRNRAQTKCLGYSSRIDLEHSYIKEMDCNHPRETYFIMIYETGRYPAHHHMVDEKKFMQRHRDRDV